MPAGRYPGSGYPACRSPRAAAGGGFRPRTISRPGGHRRRRPRRSDDRNGRGSWNGNNHAACHDRNSGNGIGNTGRPAPEPGNPFRPEEGWDEYARDHESVATDPVYPPGVTARGGILQDTDDGSIAREKQRSTIAHKLAQTGDALSLALLFSAALALAAGALILASRRRARRAR